MKSTVGQHGPSNKYKGRIRWLGGVSISCWLDISAVNLISKSVNQAGKENIQLISVCPNYTILTIYSEYQYVKELRRLLESFVLVSA
jgi:hypothetical protein